MSAAGRVMENAAVDEVSFDFEAVFVAHYPRIARVIIRVVRDPARAEELAVEVFCKLWREPAAQGRDAAAWLYRVAVRTGLDELRRQARRARYERLLGPLRRSPTPEQLHAATEEQSRVRVVLAVLKTPQAEMLVLRSDGLSYDELASALRLNATSVGTLLSRAREAFRREYVKRYGEPQYER